MSTYRRIRASDLDRERAVESISDAYVVGRLSHDELEMRCAAAYAARTWGELEDLTADLPLVRQAADLPSGAVRPGAGVARRI
jgi:hypothetical protein